MKNFLRPELSALLPFFSAGCETKPPARRRPSAGSGVASDAYAVDIVPGSAEDLRVNVGDTVHFDYDKYAILDVDKATLQRQATWLENIRRPRDHRRQLR